VFTHVLAVVVVVLCPALAAAQSAVERGRYLVEGIGACGNCHTPKGPDGRPVAAKNLAGGFEITEAFGTAVAPNITPDRETGIGDWTDGEILRAMREGISRDGRGLFPLMPYASYRAMSDEDAGAIVVYLRSMRPVRNEVRERDLKVPLNFVARRVPEPLDGPVAGPPPDADLVTRGRYLATIAGCGDCHAARKGGGGAPDPDREWEGGWELRGPWGRTVAANITPHPSTFMGQADVNAFVRRFKLLGLGGPRALPPPAAPDANTPMPWHAYAGMTVEDLTAIHAFLKSLPPVEKSIVAYPDAGRATSG